VFGVLILTDAAFRSGRPDYTFHDYFFLLFFSGYLHSVLANGALPQAPGPLDLSLTDAPTPIRRHARKNTVGVYWCSLRSLDYFWRVTLAHRSRWSALRRIAYRIRLAHNDFLRAMSLHSSVFRNRFAPASLKTYALRYSDALHHDRKVVRFFKLAGAKRASKDAAVQRTSRAKNHCEQPDAISNPPVARSISNDVAKLPRPENSPKT